MRISKLVSSTWVHVLTITVVVGIAYIRLLHPDFHASWDILTVHTYGLNYASHVWEEFGFLPFWDPFRYVGMPFVADPQPAMWYPINLVMILLGRVTLQYVQWQLVLHYVIAGLTMYAFGRYLFQRKLVAVFVGIVYPLSGVFVVHATHLGMVNTAAWFPLLLLLGARGIREQRWSFLFASTVVAALMVLAGHFQTALFLLSTYAAWVATLCVASVGWKRGVARAIMVLVVTGIGALGMSAIQVLPTYEFAQWTTRNGFSMNWALTESFVPTQWLTLLFPDFFGSVSAQPYWGAQWGSQHYAYMGIAPLLLMILGFWRPKTTIYKFFLVLFVLSTLMIIGRYSFVQPLLYLFVPLFDKIRAYANGLFLVQLSLVVLAGFGLEWFLIQREQAHARWKKLERWWIGLAGVGLMTFIGALLFDAYVRYELSNPQLSELLGNIVISGLLFLTFLVVCVVIISAYAASRIPSKRFGLLLLAVLVIDLWTFTVNHQHVATSGAVKNLMQEPFGVEYAQSQNVDHWYRTHALNSSDVLSPGFFYQTSGYNPLILERYARILRVADKSGGKFREVMTAMGVEVMFGLDDLPTDKWEAQNGVWHVNPNFRGRVWPVASVRAFPVDAPLDDIEYAMWKSDLSTTALVEGISQDQTYSTGVTISPVEERINEVSFSVDAKDRAFLVMSDTMHPGWNAYVDDAKTPLYWTDLMLRGWEVPQGSHEVVLRFEPDSVKWGATISIVTVGLVLFGWVVCFMIERKKRRNFEPSQRS